MAVRALSARAVGLTWGQRALVVGALHPRLFVGTANHTAHRRTPYTRLALTAQLMEHVFLGSREQADKALEFTRRRHAAVVGTTDEDGGPAHPAGSPYSAFDPDLMWWTAAFALDSVEFMHDHLVRPLTPGQREALLGDFVRWAELFGMPGTAAPQSYAEFRSRFDSWLASNEPHLVPEARLVGRSIAGCDGFNLPARAISSPTLRVLIQGSLPAKVRGLYGIGWSLADEAAWQALARAHRLAHRVPLLPRTPLLRGRSEEFYKVVARQEKALLRRGGVSMPGVSDRVLPER